MMAKTPRGGEIALPIPTDDDIRRSIERSNEEQAAFEDALSGIPVYVRMRRQALRMYGHDGWQAILATLQILNETELRENRGHAR